MTKKVKKLHSAYFVLAIATGLSATAISQVRRGHIAKMLFLAHTAARLALLLLFAWRLTLYSHNIFLRCLPLRTRTGFFTFVVSSVVLRRHVEFYTNNQFFVITCGTPLVLWILLTYTLFTAVRIREHKQTVDAGLHGGWLLATVATQSLTVLGASVAQAHPAYRELILFADGMLITLITYRFTFFPVRPDALVPPYWINMGAVAITTLAGASLAMQETTGPPQRALDPFLLGNTWLAWSISTW